MIARRIAWVMLSLLAMAGASLWGIAIAYTAPPIVVDRTPQPFPFDQAWSLYGGPEHRVFLGCMECVGHELEHSIAYQMGPYGRAEAYFSITNRDGLYGSPDGPYSACNAVATDPPILVNDAGMSVGRVTLNPSIHDRIQDPWIQEQLTRFCSH